MSCAAAMTEKFVSLSPDDPVEKAIKAIKKSGSDVLPVLDDDGNLIGVFSLAVLMKNLLPVSVPVSDGLEIDVKIPAAPGIAKRLNKIQVLAVGDLMDRKVAMIDPGVPLWEAVGILIQHGSPLFVVDRGSRRLKGLLTYQSVFDELSKMKD